MFEPVTSRSVPGGPDLRRRWRRGGRRDQRMAERLGSEQGPPSTAGIGPGRDCRAVRRRAPTARRSPPAPQASRARGEPAAGASAPARTARGSPRASTPGSGSAEVPPPCAARRIRECDSAAACMPAQTCRPTDQPLAHFLQGRGVERRRSLRVEKAPHTGRVPAARRRRGRAPVIDLASPSRTRGHAGTSGTSHNLRPAERHEQPHGAEDGKSRSPDHARMRAEGIGPSAHETKASTSRGRAPRARTP